MIDDGNGNQSHSLVMMGTAYREMLGESGHLAYLTNALEPFAEDREAWKRSPFGKNKVSFDYPNVRHHSWRFVFRWV